MILPSNPSLADARSCSLANLFTAIYYVARYFRMLLQMSLKLNEEWYCGLYLQGFFCWFSDE